MNNHNIERIEIFEYCYLYTVYADGTIFLLKGKNSTIYLSEKFKFFPDFSGLKSNTTKCEIARTGLLKGVQVAVFSIK